MSRKALPKPFLPLLGKETLFQAALARVADDARFAPPIVVAGAEHAALVTAQLGDLPGARVVIELAAKNTDPAIALAAALLPENAVMLVCPSDHCVADRDAFRAAALVAAALAREDYLVSFGIAADRPETGYGYLRRGAPLAGGYAIREFVEKPDRARRGLSGEWRLQLERWHLRLPRRAPDGRTRFAPPGDGQARARGGSGRSQRRCEFPPLGRTLPRHHRRIDRLCGDGKHRAHRHGPG